jgi:hypothetical protein
MERAETNKIPRKENPEKLMHSGVGIPDSFTYPATGLPLSFIHSLVVVDAGTVGEADRNIPAPRVLLFQ